MRCTAIPTINTQICRAGARKESDALVSLLILHVIKRDPSHTTYTVN